MVWVMNVQRDFAGLRHVDIAWQLVRPRTTERRTTPYAACHQLERTVASCRHRNTDGSPTSPPTLGQHSTARISCTLPMHSVEKSTPLLWSRRRSLDRAIKVFRVDAIRRAQLFGNLKLGRVDVDGEDPRCSGFDRANHCRQADAACRRSPRCRLA